jgi:hypothetical protein
LLKKGKNEAMVPLFNEEEETLTLYGKGMSLASIEEAN